jgi:hypothetical protein
LVDLRCEPEHTATAFLSVVTSHNPLRLERASRLKIFVLPRSTIPREHPSLPPSFPVQLLFPASTLPRTITTVLPRIISTTLPCTTIPPLTGRFPEIRTPPKTAAAKQPKTGKRNEAMEDTLLDFLRHEIWPRNRGENSVEAKTWEDAIREYSKGESCGAAETW